LAGSGRRVFQPGEVLTASNTMNYLMDQAVQVYAGTAARGSAIGTAVSEGMVSYLADTNAVEVYTGSNWNPISQAISPNYIINGGFDIWQRRTSFASIITGGFSADRWTNFWDGTGSARTISQQYLDPASLPGVIDNGSFFARYQQTTAGSGATYNMFVNRIENVRALAGKTVTLSFYAKAAANLTMPYIYLIQRFGTGGSAEVSTTVATNIAVTTSWVRYSYTVIIPAITGKTINDADSYTQLQIQLPINATFTWDVFGVQLEAGSTATPFRRNANSIQGELATCQRYYAQFDSGTFYAWTRSPVDVYHPWIPYPVEMRVPPTVSGSFTQGGGTFTVGTESNKRGLYLYNSANNWGTTVEIKISATMNAEL